MTELICVVIHSFSPGQFRLQSESSLGLQGFLKLQLERSN